MPTRSATALREAHEEIGLEPFEVEVLGSLPTYTTGTGFIVTPVVGLVQPGASLRPDPFEVAEVFEVPLALADEPGEPPAPRGRGRRRDARVPLDARGRASTPTARSRRYFIWGATAAMLRNLYRFLAA